MTRLLIAGASGLVGGHVLARALADSRTTQVVAPTRRPLPCHGKLVNPLWRADNLDEAAEWWAVDGVVCTLGTTRARAGSQQAFRAIDFDLQLQVARLTRQRGATRFALTSAMGARTNSIFFYSRTKGQLEQAVSALGWPSLTIVRPGLILGQRAQARPLEAGLAAVLRVVGPALPPSWRGNGADNIASALLAAALAGPCGTRVIEAGHIA